MGGRKWIENKRHVYCSSVPLVIYRYREKGHAREKTRIDRIGALLRLESIESNAKGGAKGAVLLYRKLILKYTHKYTFRNHSGLHLFRILKKEAPKKGENLKLRLVVAEDETYNDTRNSLSRRNVLGNYSYRRTLINPRGKTLSPVCTFCRESRITIVIGFFSQFFRKSSRIFRLGEQQ